MKITQLITRLQSIRQQRGDIEACVDIGEEGHGDFTGPHEISSVRFTKNEMMTREFDFVKRGPLVVLKA